MVRMPSPSRGAWLSLLLVACSDRADAPEGRTAPSSPEPAGERQAERYPDVLAARAERAADGTWTFAVTLSSPSDSPERYADAWRVLGPDGTQLGYRFLTHDHAHEQPFTRSQSGIVIPPEVAVVTIQGRDQVSGWGGATVELALER